MSLGPHNGPPPSSTSISASNVFASFMSEASVAVAGREESPEPDLSHIPVLESKKSEYTNAATGQKAPGRYRNAYLKREGTQADPLTKEDLDSTKDLPLPAFYVGRDAAYEKKRFKPTTKRQQEVQDEALARLGASLATSSRPWAGPGASGKGKEPEEEEETSGPVRVGHHVFMVDSPIEAMYENPVTGGTYTFDFRPKHDREFEAALIASRISAQREAKAERLRQRGLLRALGPGSSKIADDGQRMDAMICPVDALRFEPGGTRPWPKFSRAQVYEMSGRTHLADSTRAHQDSDVYACSLTSYHIAQTFKTESAHFLALAHRAAFRMTTHPLAFVPKNPMTLVKRASSAQAVSLAEEQVFTETSRMLSSKIARVVAIGRRFKRNPFKARPHEFIVESEDFLSARKQASLSLSQWTMLLALKSIRPLGPREAKNIESVPCHFEGGDSPILATPVVFMLTKVSASACIFLTLVLVNLRELRANCMDPVITRPSDVSPEEWHRHFLLHSYFVTLFDASGFARMAAPDASQVPQIE